MSKPALYSRQRHVKTIACPPFIKLGAFVILALVVTLSLSNNKGKFGVLASSVAPPPNLKVAFIGDTGNDASFRQVLQLIQDEGANIVLHQGDFDYVDDPDGFFATIDSVLGPDFPYFASVGNHDDAVWNTGCTNSRGCYAEHLINRMNALGVAPDEPDLNDQKYAIEYQGLKVVLVGENGNNTQFAQFVSDQLTDDPHIWKICSWHKNQTAMQVGSKGDEMSWSPYENCLRLGAIIATAHEHTYHRTRTLVHVPTQTVDPTCSEPNALCVEPGRTFVFVSGLGGHSIRNQDRCLPTTFPYGCNQEWASIYTSDQGAAYGALFITFNVNGDPRQAHGYFKNINGEIIDQFDITAAPGSGQTLSSATFYPTHDAHVSAENSSANFGASLALEVDGSPEQIAYMKFDLTSLVGKTIQSAKLRIFITDSSGSEQNIKLVADSAWSESEITYDNRPSASTLLNSIQGSAAGSWVEIDVTYGAQPRAGQFFSIALDTTGSDTLGFKSKEVGDEIPELIVKYGGDQTPGTPTHTLTPSPTPTPTPTPESIHVGDLDGTNSGSGTTWWNATVTISVHSNHHSTISGAEVTGTWSGGFSGTASCTTNSSGVCVVTSGQIHKKDSSTTFTVDSISHPTLPYHSGDNHDPDGDSNGTSITIWSTATATPTPTSTATPTSTNTPTPTSTATPTSTDTPTPTSTATPTSTDTPTPTSTATPTSTNTPTSTATATVGPEPETYPTFLPIILK